MLSTYKNDIQSVAFIGMSELDCTGLTKLVNLRVKSIKIMLQQREIQVCLACSAKQGPRKKGPHMPEDVRQFFGLCHCGASL